MQRTQGEGLCYSRRARSPLTVALVGVFLFLVAAVPSFVQQRVYKIGLTYPFPPWDIGPLKGVDYDLLSAICEANGPMDCMLEALPSEACVGTDANGNMVIGRALATGAIDGCVAWYGTDARKQLGAEFTDGYSYGPQPQLIAANGDTRYDSVGAGGSLESARVGFIAGFFNDNNCLGRHYSDFTASFYSSASLDRFCRRPAAPRGERWGRPSALGARRMDAMPTFQSVPVARPILSDPSRQKPGGGVTLWRGAVHDPGRTPPEHMPSHPASSAPAYRQLADGLK